MVEFTSTPSVDSITAKTGETTLMISTQKIPEKKKKMSEDWGGFSHLKKYSSEKSVLLEKHTAKAMQFKRTLMYPAIFACNNTNITNPPNPLVSRNIFKHKKEEEVAISKHPPTIFGM